MSDEIESVNPAEGIQPEQVQEVETQGSEATAEQEAEHQTDETPDEGKKKEPWFQRRISEITREKYEARNAAEQLRRENEQLRQALQQDPQHDDGQQPQDVRKLVQTEAQKLVEAQRFDESVSKVLQDGAKEFKDSAFKNAVTNLTMAGMDDNFIRLALDTDAPHKVIHYLGQAEHLDEATRIFSLPPTKQARELFKLEQELSKPAAKPVSKAPAPIKPIGTGGTSEGGISDDLPIDEWMRRYHEGRRKR